MLSSGCCNDFRSSLSMAVSISLSLNSLFVARFGLGGCVAVVVGDGEVVICFAA